MKKTFAAVVFAAAMALGAAPSFAETSIGQITAFDFSTQGNAIVAGGGANFANVHNSSYTLVSANEYAKDMGRCGSASGSSLFGIQRDNSQVTAVSGGLAGGASWRGGSTSGSLTVANLINN